MIYQQGQGLMQFIRKYRGQTPIVVTNGCFDLLHIGHVRLFEYCASMGVVIVLINSDDSVSELKSPTRPILPLEQRMEMIDAIRYVNVVVPFSELTPHRLICDIAPDILVKGADYMDKPVAGSECADKLVFFEGMVNVSTTKIVEACKLSTIDSVEYDKLQTELIKRTMEKDAAKKMATEFYYWWHNQTGTNTQQGFDEWWELQQTDSTT